MSMLEQIARKGEIGLLIKVEGRVWPPVKHGRDICNSKLGLGEVSVMAALRLREFTMSHMYYEHLGAQHSIASSGVTSQHIFHRRTVTWKIMLTVFESLT